MELIAVEVGIQIEVMRKSRIGREGQLIEFMLINLSLLLS